MRAIEFIKNKARMITCLYRVQTDDMDLLRAQFDAFVRQIPLLYIVLAGNTLVIAVTFSGLGHPIMTNVFPGILCGISAVRAVWWWQRRFSSFTDRQIRTHIRNTSILAVVLASSVVVWALLLYPLGDSYARGHLTFFLALTQISCVFSLMPLRPAAYGVATVGIMPFAIFFCLADGGRMRSEALIITLVGFGVIRLLNWYNRSFADLIKSRQDLHIRQIETQKLSDQNRHIALTDALTALPNRRALLAQLDLAAANQPRLSGRLGIIFIDLDGFKDINDGHGHQIGDAVINKVGRLLAQLCRETTMLARAGGDEFAILLECDDALGAAEILAEKVLHALVLPVEIQDRIVQIGASIGVAVDDTGDTNPYELLRRADTAMYRVKQNGKSGIETYDASFDAKRLWRQAVEREILEGLERDEFEVFYQPVIDAKRGAVVAVEALIRWPRRPAGPLAPDDFIEIAENSGLIQPLGLFVLRRACTDLRRFSHLKLAVNISPAQFRHPDFEGQLKQVLAETHFPPQRLQFEITEGYLIDHPHRAAKAISSFKDLGVSVALDDFGTGYTSIAYLQAYGFDIVKIDKSLLAGLGRDTKASLLVAGMVYIANALDMRVIAEGVETENQAVLLRMAGCHELQGYLFGKPEPLARLVEMERARVA